MFEKKKRGYGLSLLKKDKKNAENASQQILKFTKFKSLFFPYLTY